jgi:hypothetical protein
MASLYVLGNALHMVYSPEVFALPQTTAAIGVTETLRITIKLKITSQATDFIKQMLLFLAFVEVLL